MVFILIKIDFDIPILQPMINPSLRLDKHAVRSQNKLQNIAKRMNKNSKGEEESSIIYNT